MRLWNIIRARLRSLLFRARRESDLNEELRLHLELDTERLRASGLSGDAARRQAYRTFGGVEQTREECRDARGAGFVDALVRDVVYALRGFTRAPLVALTIVCTVALGLGLVVVAFTMFNQLLLQDDAVPDVQQMFAVERTRTSDGERQSFTRGQFEALRRETTVFTDAYASLNDVGSYLDGRLVFGTFVTGNFFDVLGVGAARGRTLKPADDEVSDGQPVIVLSHRGWERLFGRDPAILGRRLAVNGFTFEIVGVMPETFRGLTLTPDDYWAPLSMLGHARPAQQGREATGLDIIGRLKPGMSWQTARAGLAVWEASRPSGRAVDGAKSAMSLTPRRGTLPWRLEAVSVAAPVFFAFSLILLIGCANVANLLLARAVARQKEIGIRLSLGATRRRIVRQLLTESFLLALVAAAAGFAISRVVLQAVISAVMASMAADLGDIRLAVPAADWRVLLFLLGGAGVSTMLFGLAPALHAARMDAMKTIRGGRQPSSGGSAARPERARNFLIGLQVSASALLLICAAIFLRGAFSAATYNPGIRTADNVFIQVANEPSRDAIVQAVTADPSVAAVASWSDLPRAAYADAAGTKAAVAYTFASPELFDVLEIAIVRGRTFTQAERTSNLPVAVVSETTARTLWPNADAVGQALRLDPDIASDVRAPGNETTLGSRTFTVAGVVRDVAGFRFAPFKHAIVYVPTNAAAPRTSLIARVHGDPELARQSLLNRLTAIDPEMARQVTTMRTVARAETYFLQAAFVVTVVLGGLALTLTLSGLFSVLSYLVGQRTREIGVRMALGATPRDITGLVLSQSIRPVGIGLGIGGGSAAGLAALLLSTPAAATIGGIVHVLDPVAYAVSLLIIVCACFAAAAIPAARAARLDPTLALRQD
jgi:predicted permease